MPLRHGEKAEEGVHVGRGLEQVLLPGYLDDVGDADVFEDGAHEDGAAEGDLLRAGLQGGHRQPHGQQAVVPRPVQLHVGDPHAPWDVGVGVDGPEDEPCPVLVDDHADLVPVPLVIQRCFFSWYLPKNIFKFLPGPFIDDVAGALKSLNCSHLADAQLGQKLIASL